MFREEVKDKGSFADDWQWIPEGTEKGFNDHKGVKIGIGQERWRKEKVQTKLLEENKARKPQNTSTVFFNTTQKQPQENLYEVRAFLNPAIF